MIFKFQNPNDKFQKDLRIQISRVNALFDHWNLKLLWDLNFEF
jgi:hypothetical protein